MRPRTIGSRKCHSGSSRSGECGIHNPRSSRKISARIPRSSWLWISGLLASLGPGMTVGSQRRVNDSVRGDDDPLAVLPLDALDPAETRKDAAGRDVKQAAMTVLDQRPAAARFAHDPV